MLSGCPFAYEPLFVFPGDSPASRLWYISIVSAEPIFSKYAFAFANKSTNSTLLSAFALSSINCGEFGLKPLGFSLLTDATPLLVLGIPDTNIGVTPLSSIAAQYISSHFGYVTLLEPLPNLIAESSVSSLCAE